jgi:heme-degrading monooxygenase HmoA
LNAPVIALTRCFVEPSRKTEFNRVLATSAPALEEHTKPFSCGRGWKADKRVDEDEEFILFSGWNTVEDHFGFAKTESFKEFGKIRELLTGSEVKHMEVEKVK